jgi:hypothetical protein
MEYRPGDEFMGLFVRTCKAMQLEGFTPQGLSNVMNGEGARVGMVIGASVD